MKPAREIRSNHEAGEFHLQGRNRLKNVADDELDPVGDAIDACIVLCHSHLFWVYINRYHPRACLG